MKKRFLGLVCLVYVVIISYVVFTGDINNYLAPQMQIYLKISIVPMVLMGLVLCFNNKIHYRFKIGDLALLLPLAMLILAGNGRLTSDFASNRSSSFIKNQTIIIAGEKESVESDESEEKISTESDEKEEIDFEIIDSNYNELANYITYPINPSNLEKLTNKRIKVSGLSLKKASYLPENYVMIGKYSIYCCAADAEFIGFILDYDKSKVENNTWYEVEGVLEKSEDANGYTIMVVKVDSIKEIDGSKQKQNVYSCTNYGDGSCKDVTKYNLGN